MRIGQWLVGLALVALVNCTLGEPVSGQEEAPAQEKKTPQAAEADAKPNAVAADSAGQGEKKADAEKDKGWRPLLPEKGLEGWEVTDFYGHGKVVREAEQTIFEPGKPLTGITYKKKDFPTTDFEIEIEAKRIEGNDFFFGLTFPVGKGFCTYIAGGWGGGLVGLSSIDGFDASENATSTYETFENGKWYKFRVVVDEEMVRGWIGEQEYFRQERDRHEFSTRLEVFANQPLGFCVFESKVAIRNARWRPLKAAAEEAKEGKPAAAEQSRPVRSPQTIESKKTSVSVESIDDG